MNLPARRGISVALLVWVGASCGRIGFMQSQGADAGPRRDGGISDAGGVVDGAATDAPAVDGSMLDGSMLDGSVLDGSMLDGSMLDGGPPTFCGGPPILFCDDFEGATLVPPWTGAYVDPDGIVRLGTTTVHAGAGALYASQPDPGSQAYAWASLPPQSSGDLYARAYVYVPVGASTQHVDVLSLTTSQGGMTVQDQITQLALWSSVEARSLATPAVTFPEDQWVCLELRVGIDAMAGSVSVWLNGTLAISLTGVVTAATTPYDELDVGVEYVSSRQPAGAWVAVDDVVVSTARIGC